MRTYQLGVSALLLVSGLASANSGFSPLTVDGIVALQQRTDGQYDVICKTGEHEVVTDLDLRLNNVCIHKIVADPSQVLSVQKRDDGKFDVLCFDLTRKVATADEIIKGDTCKVMAPKMGKYKMAPESTESWCPQYITPQFMNGKMTSLLVEYLSPCNASNDYPCEGLICTGSGNRIEIKDSTHYVFSYSNGDYPATFVWQSESK